MPSAPGVLALSGLVACGSPTRFVTSTRDDRVRPGHAGNMVARMRELGR